MSRKFRTTNLRRKSSYKIPKQKIVILTEGEKTERDYFLAMKRKFHEKILEVEIIEAVGVPFTLAQKAKKLSELNRSIARKNSFTKNDEIWVVFDKDLHPDINKAIDLCKTSNVNVAFSDPCFELWIILHFEHYDKVDNHINVQKHLEKLCPAYSRKRGKTINFDTIIENIVIAEDRAQRQFKNRNDEGYPLRTPYTTVFNLTRSIRLR